MSKIGQQPVEITQGVEVRLEDDQVIVKGPKGELSLPLPDGIEVKVEENKVLVNRRRHDRKTKACHGTIRSLIHNMVVGVTEGWSKGLEVVGTGYGVTQQGNKLVFKVGFSHPVEVEVPEGLSARVEDNKVFLEGVDKQLVGQFADRIRKIRPPDAYKGKGIRYVGEEVKLKPGKTARTMEG